MPDKSIAQRLFIKEDYKVLIVNGPKDYNKMLGSLPKGVTIVNKSDEPVDFIQIFINSKKELESQLPVLKKLLKPDGLLWVSYPKGTSKIKVDINRDSIREYAQSIGLQAVAMISLDDTWSALRLKVV